MTYLAKPKLHHPELPQNALGLTRRDYEGTVSTLCAGCGHDSISAAIIQACWELALQPGATYVARSFSGDKTQLVPLIKGALTHQGAAFIDVISPCVAFNNHEGSTKSYDYIRDHNEAVNVLDVITVRKEITTDYEPGSVQEVRQHDGSVLRLRKLAADYDAGNRIAAMNHVLSRDAEGEIA